MPPATWMPRETAHDLLAQPLRLAQGTYLPHVALAVWAAGFLFVGLRGLPGLPLWVALFVPIALLSWSLSPRFRRRAQACYAGLRGALHDYPQRSEHTPWLGVFAWVVFPAALLLLTREYAITSNDSKPVFLTTASLATEGNGDLSEFLAVEPLPYCFQHRGGGIYSSYPSGMVVFALPVAVASRLLGADLGDPAIRARLEKWTAGWLSAVCLGLFFLLALHVVSPTPAWVMTGLLATGSVFHTTIGQALWQQGGVIFWMLTILLVEFRLAVRPVAGGTLIQGSACALMLACRLSAALFVVPFGVWILLREWRRAWRIAAVAALAYLPWAAFHLSTYGTPFGPSTAQAEGSNWSMAGLTTGAAGVLFSPGRGLFVYQPWLVLLVGLLPFIPFPSRPAARVPCPAGWKDFCLGYLLLHLVLISAWRCWWGGHCWGSRLAAEVVPIAALLCLLPLQAILTHRAGRGLVLALALLGGSLHLPAVFLKQDAWNRLPNVDRHPERLWHWRSSPFLHRISR